MIKRIIIFLILLTPVFLYSQGAKKKNKSSFIKTAIPSQAQYSNKFKITGVYFNRRIDYSGKGEVLEVELFINNQLDNPQDLYIFVVATFEKSYDHETSFMMPIPDSEKLKSFVPFPYDLKNFEYPDIDIRGKVKKDRYGKDKIKYVKFPKNTKAGVDPKTGKPYHLEEKKIVRTFHLSKYRNNYFFFNAVAILIFDRDGKPSFRQLYDLVGYRK